MVIFVITIQHLETPIPEDSDYEEMICTNCVKRCSFLNYYAAFSKGRFIRFILSF